MRASSCCGAACVLVVWVALPAQAEAQVTQNAAPPNATPQNAATQDVAAHDAATTDLAAQRAAAVAPVVPVSAVPGEGSVVPANAGFNGEHFYIRSSDGQFQLSPFGYLNANYTAYDGDGAPPNGFAIKRARLGFQGFFGKPIEYMLSADVVANGVSVRDAYVQIRPFNELQLRVGQFKEPFSQEVATVDTNVEFFDRSLLSVLYPSALGSFRSPGAMLFGTVDGGTFDYFVGVFNGRGILAPSSSNWPEVVGRLRISPLRWTKSPAVRHLAIGGSISFSREAAISGDQSFSGLINDGAYTFFPSFLINGPVQRYGGDFMWLVGPVGLRGEYAELHQAREDVGSGAVQGGGYESYPAVVGRGAYGQLSCFLTGETEEEYDPPKVRHPLVGPATPGTDGAHGAGAIQLAARFSWIYATAPGATFATFAPTSVASYLNNTDQITVGVNWYLNYWMLYKVDLDIDQLRQPSVQGILPQNYYVVIQQVQFRF
jgi:phosphate-selective porin OprO and OprP